MERGVVYKIELPCGKVTNTIAGDVRKNLLCTHCNKTWDLSWITDMMNPNFVEPKFTDPIPVAAKKEFKDTNPKSKAATNRLDLSLVPESLDVFASLGMTEGDAKYGGYNYRVLGVRVSTYIAALKRHTARFEAGEWADPDTKVPHLANMAADLAILIDGFVSDNINDDRPPAQPKLLKLLTESQDIVKHLYDNFLNEDNPRMTEKNKDGS